VRKDPIVQWSELEELLMADERVTSAGVTCTGAPVQMDGTLADGRFWYFRSRGSHASLGVGRTPVVAVDDESLDIPIDGPEFTASWLSPDDTVGAFFRLLSQR
jgi:hypothetical protein